MQRTIGLALNKFLETPPSLLLTPNNGAARTNIDVNLANLYHHYFVDSYGIVPPDPDPAHFEYLSFLTQSADFRFQGRGIGHGTHKRRNCSQELGQAFCRWFLHDHLDITYFAHISHILDKGPQDQLGALSIERADSGDTPDYFCAEGSKSVFLAEAKGRFDAIGFDTKDFTKWRKQFERVMVKDSAGICKSVKGFIVATRFATEKQSNLKSKIFAEDPSSRGDLPINEIEARTLSAMILSIHYSYIALKMNQQILAAALLNGFAVPDDILFPATVWQFNFPYEPLQNRRFIGGYYSRTGMPLPVRRVNDRILINYSDPFRLDYGGGTFYGLEESIFEQVTRLARVRDSAFVDIRKFDYAEPFYSAISILRDGSILAPIEFFQPIEERDF